MKPKDNQRKSMKINEMQGKSMKSKENKWESMKPNENQWEPMIIHENQRKIHLSKLINLITLINLNVAAWRAARLNFIKSIKSI